MRKLAFIAVAAFTIGLAATGCSSTYSRDETIDNLVEDAGLTEEQATCVVDTLEDEVGTDELDKAVNQEDPEDLSPEIQAALQTAAANCAFAE